MSELLSPTYFPIPYSASQPVIRWDVGRVVKQATNDTTITATTVANNNNNNKHANEEVKYNYASLSESGVTIII
jgi:hypothetical protein